MSDIEKLKKKVQKLSAVLDFYSSLKTRKIKDSRELKDAKLKLDFAKKQILNLCLESKNIIRNTENRETVS